MNGMQCAGGHATGSSPGGRNFLVHNGLQQMCEDLIRAERNRDEYMGLLSAWVSLD